MKTRRIIKLPVKMKITSRISSITNAFVSSIIPAVVPQESEIAECLEILGLDLNDLRCVYCGEKATEWDHLRPLVIGKKPSGYISDIKNLVPSCGNCNHSKGNRNWKDFIMQKAQESNNQIEIKNYNARIKRLEKYENWGQITAINFEKLIDKDIWKQYWELCENLHNEMKRCQNLADQINVEIKNKLSELGYLT
jgi:hypothetical protein